jgi:hypothetical protein
MAPHQHGHASRRRRETVPLRRGVGIAGFAIVLGVTVLAKTDTVKGQIVDQTCYQKDPANNKGVDHKMPADRVMDGVFDRARVRDSSSSPSG